MGDKNNDIGGDLRNYDCDTDEFSDSQEGVDFMEEFGMDHGEFEDLMNNARKSYHYEAPFPPPEAYELHPNRSESLVRWLIQINERDQRAFYGRDPDEPGSSRMPYRRPGSPPNPAYRNYELQETRKDWVKRKQKKWKQFKPKDEPPPDYSIGGGFLEGAPDSPPIGNFGNFEERELADSPIGSPEFRAGLMGEPICRKRKRIHEDPYEDCSDESDIEWETQSNRLAERYRMKNRTPPKLNLHLDALAETGREIRRRDLRPGQNSPSPTQPESAWFRTRPGPPTPARDAYPVTPCKRPKKRAQRNYENDWGEGNSLVHNSPSRRTSQPIGTPLRPVYLGQVFSSPETISEEDMETVELPDFSTCSVLESTPKIKIRQAKDPARRANRSYSKSPDPLARTKGHKRPTRRKLKKRFKKAKLEMDHEATMRREKRWKEYNEQLEQGKKKPLKLAFGGYSPVKKGKKCRDPDCKPPHCPHVTKGRPLPPGKPPDYRTSEDSSDSD